MFVSLERKRVTMFVLALVCLRDRNVKMPKWPTSKHFTGRRMGSGYVIYVYSNIYEDSLSFLTRNFFLSNEVLTQLPLISLLLISFYSKEKEKLSVLMHVTYTNKSNHSFGFTKFCIFNIKFIWYLFMNL